MKTTGMKSLLFAGSALAAASLTASAAAQDTGNALGIENIIVTSRKVSESLQDAPLSITAITGDGLKLRDIQTASGISDFAPNVSFGVGGGSGSGAQANLFIRGVGQNDFSLVTDPGVGLYVDGVYYARVIGSSIDLVDVARIEALRGPQGTLFGRNTIGGAISITTTDPDMDALSGDVRVIVGGDERIEAYGSVNVPLRDDLAVLVSGLVRSREGTVIDASGRELGNDNVRGGRLKAVWTPSERLRVTLSADYVHEDEGGLAEVALVRAADGSVDNANTDFFRSTSSIDQGPNTNVLDNWGVAMTVDYALSDVLAVKSVTAYRSIDGLFHRNPASGSNFNSRDVYEQSQVSQELQLLGDYEAFSFVVGGFAFWEDGFNTAIIDIPPSPAPFPREVGVSDISNRSFALFAEATVPITERLRVIAGVRYTDEEKDASFTSASVPGLSPGTMIGDPIVQAIGFENPQSLSFSEVTYRAIVQFDVTDELNTYVSWSTGFKSGGFNQRLVGFAPGQITMPDSFEPEEIGSAEIGVKYENDILRLNLSGFYSDYTNVQISGAPPGSIATETFNGAEAEIYGFELEGMITPMENLLIDFSVGVQEAQYLNVEGTGTEITVDDSFVRTPPFTVAVGGSYVYPLGDSNGSLRVRADVFVSGEVFFEPQNAIATNEDGYAYANASVSWLSDAESWQVTLGVNNITDSRYLIAGDANAALGYDLGVFARPRNWFFAVETSF